MVERMEHSLVDHLVVKRAEKKADQKDSLLVVLKVGMKVDWLAVMKAEMSVDLMVVCLAGSTADNWVELMAVHWVD